MTTTLSCGSININHEAAIGFETINLTGDDVYQLTPPDGACRATLQFISTTGIEGIPQSKPIARITEFSQLDLDESFDNGSAIGKSFYTFDYMYYYVAGIKNIIQTRIKKATGVEAGVDVYVQVQYHK